VQLGNLLRRDEEYEGAESAYSRAIDRLGTPEREDWTLFYARGIAYERTKQWPKAEADFLRALELEPEQPFVLNYLGYSWVDQGMRLDEARDMLDRAVALRPDDGFIVDSVGWVHYRLGEYPQAVESLERAVELEPGDPVINDHLGDAYWRVGRQREARYQWQRALSLEPDEELIETIEQKLRSGLPPPDRA
jgi:Flp pilus assembly protein TadD